MNPYKRESAFLLNTQVFLSCCNKNIDISKLEEIQELSFDLPERVIVVE